MTHDHTHHDLWMEYSRRKAEWRARRAQRREAWRRTWRKQHGGCGWGHTHADENGTQAADAETARVAEMEKTIADLSERIKVLERIVVTDEPRLAAEIERLRRNDDVKGE